jgi:hypothetical protein
LRAALPGRKFIRLNACRFAAFPSRARVKKAAVP